MPEPTPGVAAHLPQAVDQGLLGKAITGVEH